MREILFRGKRIDNGAWVEGSPVFYGEKVIMIEPKLCIKELPSFGWVQGEVVPETVGQFTGLCDKNGKKIFEGDILCVLERIPGKTPTVEIKLNYEVIYKYGSFRSKGNEYEDFTLADLPLYYLQFVTERNNNLVEIIGNIHDNKELLEVKE